MFSIKRFLQSFFYAGRGLLQVFYEEQSFRLQVLATLIIIILAIYFKISLLQFIFLLIVITMVLVLELINSVFERVVDIIKPGVHDYARSIKDIMAATVLIASIAALIVGVIIFYPYLFN